MPSALRTILWVLAVPIALACIVALALSTAPAQHWLGDRIEGFVGPALKLGRIQLSLHPILGLTLDDAHLVDPTSPDAPSAVTVRSARLSVDLEALWSGDLAIESLLVSDVAIRLEPGSRGETTLARAISSLAERFAADAGEVSEGRGNEPASAAESEVADPFHLPLSLRDVVLEVHRADDEPLVVGVRTLEADNVFSDEAGAIRFDVDVSPGEVGRIEARGLYGAGGVDDAVEFELEISDLPASEFLSEPLGGFARYAASLEIEGTLGSASTAPDLRGSGRIDFNGGDLAGSNAAKLIFDTLLTIVPKGDAAPEKRKEKNPAKIDHLRARLEIGDGAIDISDLTFVTDDFLVEGTGVVSFGLDVLFDLDVALTTSGVSRLLTSARLPVPDEIGKLPPTPMQIRGKGRQLTGRPKIAHMPLAAAGYAVDTAVGAGKGLFSRALSVFKSDDESAEGGADAETKEEPGAD